MTYRGFTLTWKNNNGYAYIQVDSPHTFTWYEDTIEDAKQTINRIIEKGGGVV